MSGERSKRRQEGEVGKVIHLWLVSLFFFFPERQDFSTCMHAPNVGNQFKTEEAVQEQETWVILRSMYIFKMHLKKITLMYSRRSSKGKPRSLAI